MHHSGKLRACEGFSRKLSSVDDRALRVRSVDALWIRCALTTFPTRAYDATRARGRRPMRTDATRARTSRMSSPSAIKPNNRCA